MSVPLICVLWAFLLCILSKAPLALAMARQPGGYNNRHPRDQQAALAGWGRRSLAAHVNTFESFPGFAAAVIIASLAEVPLSWLSPLAIVFIVMRVAYIGFYLVDLHILRSAVWTVGFGITVVIFLLPVII
jgi:uncharacterized MAPEG superfamily protein